MLVILYRMKTPWLVMDLLCFAIRLLGESTIVAITGSLKQWVLWTRGRSEGGLFVNWGVFSSL